MTSFCSLVVLHAGETEDKELKRDDRLASDSLDASGIRTKVADTGILTEMVGGASLIKFSGPQKVNLWDGGNVGTIVP